MPSNRRYLIDHHKSFAVRQTHDLFRIGIVRGAEGVCANPFHEIQIFHIAHFIQSAPVYMGVLMSPKSLEIERLPVNQEFPVLDRHSPNAERLLVCIDTLPMLPQFYHTGIQVGVQRLPEMHTCDGELTTQSS